MKFNIKLLNYKRLYIHFCFLALINIFFSTDNLYAKTFVVNDIEISTPFVMNFDKNEIIDEGFEKAFDQLIKSMVKTNDQEKLRATSLSMIKGMIEMFSIKEEKFINEIYSLSLNVSFNKKKIFDFLESKNIFPSLPISKKVFFIPIVLDEDKDEIIIFSESYFFNNWNYSNKKYHLLNYILPTEDLEDFNLIKAKSNNLENYDFKEIINKYNLNDYIIMIVFKNSRNIRIFNKISFNEKIDIKNFNYRNLKLNNDDEKKQFIEKFKNIYENYWKLKNQMNTSVKLSLIVSVDNSLNSNIAKFEQTIHDLDFLYDFYIYKFNNEKNIYKIIFNGTPDNFIKIMNDNNYEIDTQNKIWQVK